MKTRFITPVLALVAALSLTACHGVARKTYVGAGAQPMRTVGVLAIPKTKSFAVADLGFKPGLMFGAIGGLVQGLADAYVADEVNDAVRARGYDPAGELEAELARVVREAGYEAVSVGGPVRGRDGFAESYAALTPRTDLYLDASIAAIGFQTSAMGQPWRIATAVPVRLVSGSTGEVLYSDMLVIGEKTGFSEVKSLAGVAEHTYPSYTDIRDRPDDAVEGMRKAIRTVAAEVGTSIGRGPLTVAAVTAAEPVADATRTAASFAPTATAPAVVTSPVSTSVPSWATGAPASTATIAPPPAAPAVLAVAAPEASIAATDASLGRCKPATVQAMKRDGANEREISGACQATLEATRTFLQ